jgi:catechol 2,3-dioxygenase-like lactoylglutathione lyase family enzyme
MLLPMRATRVNHVSIPADDLDVSARFYEELFGAERIPTAIFPEPVLWLRVGANQLHLFTSDEDHAQPRQHLAFDVDDFEAVYAKAKQLGILDSRAFGSPLRTHPAGWAQLYLRDPAGNLVEVDCPDAASLSETTLADALPLDQSVEQIGEAMQATLYT